MKNTIFYFLIIFYLGTSGFAQVNKILSPLIQCEFDAVTTQIWLAAEQRNVSKMNVLNSRLLEEWNKNKILLEKSRIQHYDIKGFSKDVGMMVNNLVLRINERDFIGAKDVSYHILLEMRSMRNCVGYEIFPLDELWWLYDEYEGIRYVVNDKMFGKYEWFEFKDMIFRMQCKYEVYDFISTDIIKSFYPEFNTVNHDVYKKDLAKCVGDFMDSLKSGYQPDFVQPCDEIGYKLKQIMSLYTPNPKKAF